MELDEPVLGGDDVVGDTEAAAAHVASLPLSAHRHVLCLDTAAVPALQVCVQRARPAVQTELAERGRGCSKTLPSRRARIGLFRCFAASQVFLQAVQPDVLVVTHPTDMGPDDVIALAVKEHREANAGPLRSVCFWHAGLEALPEKLSAAELDTHDADPQKAAAKAAFAKAEQEREHAELARALAMQLRESAEALCRGVTPLLEISGRVHILTNGVLEPEGPLHLDDGAETELLLRLETLSKRHVSVTRGELLEEGFMLLALDRVIVNVSHVYFDTIALRNWQFARNRQKTGINPNAITMAGVQDVTDKRMLFMTYLKEIPFLYSVMIGSFLLLFVPENCTSYVPVCSGKENTGTGTAFGAITLALNWCVRRACMPPLLQLTRSRTMCPPRSLTAASFVVSDVFFHRRETWMIEWLDADDEFPPTHLKHVIDRYPRIKAALRSHNVRCTTLSLWTASVVLLNFAVSAAYVLRKVGHEVKECCPGVLPGETKTITTLITNTLLVFLKLLHHVRTSRRSLLETAGISSAHLMPLTYNVIDHGALPAVTWAACRVRGTDVALRAQITSKTTWRRRHCRTRRRSASAQSAPSR